MKKIDLNGSWKMKNITEKDWIDAKVPGTVFSDLRHAGLADDPFYRDNEDKIQKLFCEDYEYVRTFEVTEDAFENDEILLCCEGLDTLADIFLNQKPLAKVENMHRTYQFNAREYLVTGTNEIHIVFHSPKKYIDEHAKFSSLPSVLGNTGVEQLRKAQCMFGWDWGLSLPDMGIWRNIYIACNKEAVIDDFYFTQEHANKKVTLQAKLDFKLWTKKLLTTKILVNAPDGRTFSANGVVDAETKTYTAHIEIDHPQLWWPNGYGAQPLYEITLLLKDGDTVIDRKMMQIGLRTIVLSRETDEWGESYEFVINGKALFMRGSNLIIEDSVLTGYSAKRTEKMLKDCVAANFNCIRVWGGSLYPADLFYELCDRLGLVVYQDFMFACHAYPATEEFLENVKAEVTDNVKRIRHHACLGLWSGNNEIETIFEIFMGDAPLFVHIRNALHHDKPGAEQERKLKDDYLKLFGKLIPETLSVLDPQTSYTRCSSSNIEPFKGDPFDFNSGDMCQYRGTGGGVWPGAKSSQTKPD
ncbi:hypothetical protein FACS18947_5490 [Bacteroidia bacterium]|nr:hypothetical protein FACS18947_5490 [Bacteroidia bacterium]